MTIDNNRVSDSFLRFVEIIRQLRTPETGCPWDLEQDHRSLRPYLIEEAYEVIDAIDKGDDKSLVDELGDLLLQVVLHSQVASDRNAFSIADVATVVADKMVRRHPHVFGELEVSDSKEVLKNWEEIKRQENKAADPENQSSAQLSQALSNIPSSMPALIRAQRMGEKAAKFSFDWDSVAGVMAKVKEEIGELEVEVSKTQTMLDKKQKLSSEMQQALEHELGDLLFSVVQLARWLGIGAEDSLRGCNERFLKRLQEVENLASAPLNKLDQDQLELLWQQAKKTSG